MSAVEGSCPICYEDFDPSERFLEGHQVGEALHVFDSHCIRGWFNMLRNLQQNLSCPTCRSSLEVKDLIQISNPNFSMIKMGLSWINRAKARIPSISQIGKVVLPTAAFGCLVYTTSAVAIDLFPEFFSKIGSGSKSVIASMVITGLSIGGNKMITGRYINEKMINKIYAVAVLAACYLTATTEIHYLSDAVGTIAGALFTASMLRMKMPYLKEPGTFRFGPIPNNYVSSEFVLESIATTSAYAVAAVALGALAKHCTNNWGILVQTTAAVSAGVIGGISTLFVDYGSCLSIDYVWGMVTCSSREPFYAIPHFH